MQLKLPWISCVLATALCGGCGGGGGDTPEIALHTLTSGDAALWGAAMDGRVPGLARFSLEYLNGDHHVSTIMVGGLSSGASGPDFDSFLLGFNDDDYGPFGTEAADPVAMSVEFYDLQGIAPRMVTSGHDLDGVARLEIDELLPGETLVLGGFTFQTDGPNHQIRVLRITPFPEAGYIEVEYRDDSPSDDLYFASVVYSVIPAERYVGSGMSPSFDGPHAASFPFLDTDSRSRGLGVALIHSFDLQFRTGDRNLERVAVDLTGGGTTATFRDGDPSATDDLVDFDVEYVRVFP